VKESCHIHCIYVNMYACMHFVEGSGKEALEALAKGVACLYMRE